MKSHLKILLFFYIITLSTSCKSQDKKEIQTKNLSKENVRMLNDLEPLKAKSYEKWLPKKISNFKLTSHEINGKIDESSNNNIQLVYENKPQKIEVIIVDAAKNASSLEMIYFAFDMDKQFSKDEKKEHVTNNEPHHINKYDKEKKIAQILTVIEGRFGVSASGKNINSRALWEFIKKLNIGKLNKK